MAINQVIKSFSLSAVLAATTVITVSKINMGHTNNNVNLNFSAFKNLAANLNEIGKIENKNQIKDQNAIVIDSHSEKREEAVLASISKELDTVIKNRKNAIGHLEQAILRVKNKRERLDNVHFKLSGIKRKNIQSSEEDLSMFEINNKELIELSAFNYEEMRIAKINIPDLNAGNFVDEVKLASSSVTGPIGPKKNNLDQNSNDDSMVMFDYSSANENKNEYSQKNENNFDKRLYDRPISETVKNAIHREMGVVKKLELNERAELNLNLKKKTDIEKIIKEVDESENEDQVDFEYSSVAKNKNNKIDVTTHDDKKMEAFSASTEQVDVSIQAMNVNMTNQKQKKGYSFEFTPDYDRNERMNDNNSGIIKIGYSTESDKVSILSGVLEQRGMMTTRLDIPMTSQKLVVPSFEEESYIKFLESLGISNATSVMVSMINGIIDAELDTQYQGKIYLNKKFKETSKENEKQFILFLNVKAGNSLLKYQTSNGNAEKIIYVGENEIFFEEPSFTEGSRETFELTTRGLMSLKAKELNLDSTDVKYFNQKKSSKKVSLNSYEIKIPELVLGARKYLEINHQGNNVFIGADKNTNVEVSNKEFVAKILEFNQLRSLDDRCLVQLNIKNELSDYRVNGKNMTGDMFIETSFLDMEGSLNKENAEMAEKMFIVGEREGMISVKLDYSNGTSEVLKTMCSNGTFLIEQL